MSHFLELQFLNGPDTLTLLVAFLPVARLLKFPFLSHLWLPGTWEVLQDLDFDILPILLSVPIFLLFRPSKRPPSYHFHKARLDDSAVYFNCQCPSAEKYSTLPLSFAAPLFTFLALNVAKSSILFGRIKLLRQAWRSSEVEETYAKNVRHFLLLTEVMKIVRLTSLHRGMPRLSLQKPKYRYGRRHPHLFLLNLSKNLCIFSSVLSMALLPHFSPILTSSTALLSRNRHRFWSSIRNLTFLFTSPISDGLLSCFVR